MSPSRYRAPAAVAAGRRTIRKPRPRGRPRRLISLAAASFVLVVPLLLPGARAVLAASVQISNMRGFDGCQTRNGNPHLQPTTSQMQAFWTGTPLGEYYLYLGGSTAYCGGSSSGVSASWVSAVLAQHWGLVGVWVGPQCCGTASSTVISTNTTTAYNQGESEADLAGAQMCSWGLCAGLPEPIVYDFETDTNPTAQHAFLRGWVTELQKSDFGAGAYSSVCRTTNEITSWNSLSPKVTFIWPAQWNNTDTVWGLSCGLSNSYWPSDQRHHQYRGGHSQTYNGVTLYIDSDCANGPVYGANVSYADAAGDDESQGGPVEDASCT
jgi:hypothetical protein